MSVLVQLMLLAAQLGPELQTAVLSLVRALKGQDPKAARAAFESALRLQFIARNTPTRK